jgi:hypothetical protein
LLGNEESTFLVVIVACLRINKHICHSYLQVKNQARFSRFQDKVVHFVLDDEETVQQQGSMKMFDLERHMEHRRWQKFVQSKNIYEFS